MWLSIDQIFASTGVKFKILYSLVQVAFFELKDVLDLALNQISMGAYWINLLKQLGVELVGLVNNIK